MDTSSQYLKVDRKSEDILSRLREAPIYRKQGSVMAEMATRDQKIVTSLGVGIAETTKIAKAGDWIITNPTGEQYTIDNETFSARYAPTRHEGIFIPTGHCRAILNPYNQPVEIQAEWDEPQYGDAKCWFADTCDADGNLKGEPYLIAGEPFAATYALKL